MGQRVMMSEKIRRISYFSGRVQGVGFRYTAQDVARGFKVIGYVRNLPDGRVELVAEGEAAEIDKLLDAVSEKMEGFIKNRTDSDSPATEEFRNFSIRH
jgi:acylphosphatase